jgi:hypothetical protein
VKLETSTPLIDARGIEHRGAFQMRATATAFKILSSSLYSDKIGAVLREYGCNAADSHIAAGKADVPFDVKLPTPLNDEFYIRDYGTGLDADEVRDLFTTYFASTKDQSNDFTGAFGLGSKSAFAYTDSFSVRAAKDGTVRSFLCYFDEYGAPALSLVDERASPDWPNGIEVGFAVARKDVSEFERKAKRIFGVFHTPPIINGALQPSLLAEVLPGVYGFTGERAYYSEQMFCRVGNVAYPVNLREVEYNFSYTEFGQFLGESAVILEVPLGEVDIAVSRESLDYTDKTKSAIMARIYDLEGRLTERLKEIVTAADTRTIEGLEELYEQLTTSGVSARLMNHLSTALKDITPEHFTLGDFFASKQFTPYADGVIPVALQTVYRRLPTGSTKSYKGVITDYTAGAFGFKSNTLRNKLGSPFMLVIDDLPLKHAGWNASRDGVRRATHITKETGTEIHFARFSDTMDRAAITTMIEALPFVPPYAFTSDLVKPEKQAKGVAAARIKTLAADRAVATIDLTKQSGTDNWECAPGKRFGDLPVATTYYLTRTASWGRMNVEEVDAWSLHDAHRAFRAAHRDGAVLGTNMPTHIIIDTKTNMKRAKLEEAGIKCYSTWLNDTRNELRLNAPTPIKGKQQYRRAENLEWCHSNSTFARWMVGVRELAKDADENPAAAAAWPKLAPYYASSGLVSLVDWWHTLPDGNGRAVPTSGYEQLANVLGVSVPTGSRTQVGIDQLLEEWQTAHYPVLDLIRPSELDLSDADTLSKVLALLEVFLPVPAPLLAAVA